MVKIKSIKFKNHPIFGDKKIEFVTQSGEAAETVVIVGENGTGKTNLLRILGVAYSAIWELDKESYLEKPLSSHWIEGNNGSVKIVTPYEYFEQIGGEKINIKDHLKLSSNFIHSISLTLRSDNFSDHEVEWIKWRLQYYSPIKDSKDPAREWDLDQYKGDIVAQLKRSLKKGVSLSIENRNDWGVVSVGEGGEGVMKLIKDADANGLYFKNPFVLHLCYLAKSPKNMEHFDYIDAKEIGKFKGDDKDLKSRIFDVYQSSFENSEYSKNTGFRSKTLDIFFRWIEKFSDDKNSLKFRSINYGSRSIFFYKKGEKQEYEFKDLSDGERKIIDFALPFLEVGTNEKAGDDGVEKILLIDEIGSYMHPRWQSRILRFVKEINKGYSQIFVSTHSEITPYSINLDHDSLISLGTPEENVSFRNYNSISEFVRTTLGVSHEEISDEADVWLEGRSDKIILNFAKSNLPGFLPFNFCFVNNFKPEYPIFYSAKNLDPSSEVKTLPQKYEDGTSPAWNADDQDNDNPLVSMLNWMTGAVGVWYNFSNWLLRNFINNGGITFFIVDHDPRRHSEDPDVDPDNSTDSCSEIRKVPNGSEIFQFVKGLTPKIYNFGSIHIELKDEFLGKGRVDPKIFEVIEVIKSVSRPPEGCGEKHEVAYFMRYKSPEEGRCVSIESFIEDFLKSKFSREKKFKKGKYEEIIKVVERGGPKSVKKFANYFKDYFRDLKKLYKEGKKELERRK